MGSTPALHLGPLMPLPNGTEIGGSHRVEGRLGQGAFGITYRVRDPKSGALRALKEYAPSEWAYRDDRGRMEARPGFQRTFDEGLTAFRTEAEFLRDLGRHSNIVRVRALFTKFNTAYILMDLVEGSTLRTVISSAPRPSESQLMTLLRRIGGALAHLHNARLLHRDVKPENIMMNASRHPILIDFGAARHIRPALAHTRIFTPEYAPVEQQGAFKGQSPRMFEGPWTDIFALGVMAHELACGQRPPGARERLATLIREHRDPYRPLQHFAKEAFAPAFCQGVDRACALLPQDRPGSVEEWLGSLEGSQRPSGRTQHQAWGPARELTQEDLKQIIVVPPAPKPRRAPKLHNVRSEGNNSEPPGGLTIFQVVALFGVVGVLAAAVVASAHILNLL